MLNNFHYYLKGIEGKHPNTRVVNEIHTNLLLELYSFREQTVQKLVPGLRKRWTISLGVNEQQKLSGSESFIHYQYIQTCIVF